MLSCVPPVNEMGFGSGSGRRTCASNGFHLSSTILQSVYILFNTNSFCPPRRTILCTRLSESLVLVVWHDSIKLAKHMDCCYSLDYEPRGLKPRPKSIQPTPPPKARPR